MKNTQRYLRIFLVPLLFITILNQTAFAYSTENQKDTANVSYNLHIIEYEEAVNAARMSESVLSDEADLNEKPSYLAIKGNPTNPETSENPIIPGRNENSITKHRY